MRTPVSTERLPHRARENRASLPAREQVIPARARHAEPAAATGALWLHVHLPWLPLEVLTRGVSTRRACVLAAGEGSRRKAMMVNTRAAALGVRVGMPLGAAHALGELTVLARDGRAEQQALDKLCLWAMQLSPMVSPVAPDGLLVEVQGSLKLFNGVDGLGAWLRREFRDLGYRVQCALAPTPLAATALARSNARTAVLARHDLPSRLSSLPLETLRLEAREMEALESIGVRCIGDCRRLPRGGLARRFSPALNDTMDRLFGRIPDPRTSFPVPRCFQAAVELPWELDNAQALVVAGERLLRELTGYLRANDAVTRTLNWHLTDRDNSRTGFGIGLARPGRDIGHMCLLLREKLMRMTLEQPVRAVGLYVDDVMRGLAPRTNDLFERKRGADDEAYAGFVDRLRSRCGERALRGLATQSDHRPERAWCWRRPDSVRNGSMPVSNASGEQGTRPLWLMHQPQTLEIRQGRPHFDGPLDLTPERERIDTGWWDGHAVARDYFVARTPGGNRLWVFKELSGERRWRLHGFFE